jgi:hypothetical protein
MALFRAGRPLKRWRYVGVFCGEVSLCAASIRVGPAAQTFWAVHERSSGRLHERTRLIPRRSTLSLPAGGLLIDDGGVTAKLTLQEDDGIQATCANGRAYVWTRKQAGIRARGTLAIGGGLSQEINALAVVDDTAGYHARVTEWRWAAGVGTALDGTTVAFNLVQGVNDPPSGSERAVWVDGTPHEVGAVRISDDLRTIEADDGSKLSFSPEAQRHRRENLLLVRSEYRAPFGTFSGSLPGGIAIAHALGVVEHHRAHW